MDRLIRRIVFASVLSAAMLFGTVFSSYGYHVQMAVAAPKGNNTSTAMATTTSTATPGAIQLSAKGMMGSYTWINTSNGAINPTLNLKANTNQTIKIQNPTDTKHQLIVDQNGKQLATSGDIAPGSSGQVSFKPNMAGTFGYHCLYHPTTMKGIIQVQGTTAGGNPTVSNSTTSSSTMPKSTASTPPTTGPKY